jgi:hypothetical protein
MSECAEVIARQFHAVYERFAPHHGWETQERSRTEWGDLPEANRTLMVATVEKLLERGAIVCGEHRTERAAGSICICAVEPRHSVKLDGDSE